MSDLAPPGPIHLTHAPPDENPNSLATFEWQPFFCCQVLTSFKDLEMHGKMDGYLKLFNVFNESILWVLHSFCLHSMPIDMTRDYFTFIIKNIHTATHNTLICSVFMVTPILELIRMFSIFSVIINTLCHQALMTGTVWVYIYCVIMSMITHDVNSFFGHKLHAVSWKKSISV